MIWEGAHFDSSSASSMFTVEMGFDGQVLIVVIDWMMYGSVIDGYVPVSSPR